jgi:hypothetical protein
LDRDGASACANGAAARIGHPRYEVG